MPPEPRPVQPSTVLALSRTLRAGSAGAAAVAAASLTAAARGALPDGRSGRRDGPSPIEQRDVLLTRTQPRPLAMPNLLNLTHTTAELDAHNWRPASTKEHPDGEDTCASERTREKLRALIERRSEAADERSELVRLAARLIIEKALEGGEQETWWEAITTPAAPRPAPDTATATGRAG